MVPAYCPVCQKAVKEFRAKDKWVHENTPFFKYGGPVISAFMSALHICVTLRWACQATDPKDRPPLASLPIKFVRISIVEADGKTVGTATALLEDGMNFGKLLHSTSLSGVSLNERVTADGRHQCMWMQCLKMQDKGGKAFARRNARRRRGGRGTIKGFVRGTWRWWTRGRW